VFGIVVDAGVGPPWPSALAMPYAAPPIANTKTTPPTIFSPLCDGGEVGAAYALVGPLSDIDASNVQSSA
jgi:hypothetical protein